MNKKNKMKAIIAIAVALAFMVPSSAVIVNDVLEDITNVRFDPSEQRVKKGETFTASYYVEPTDWVAGAFFDTITFNPTLLQADLTVAKGGFFGGKEKSFWGGDVDNTAGTIKDGYAAVESKFAVNTSGAVFVITFTAQQTLGTSDLVMESGVLIAGDEPGEWLDYTLESGSVIVEGDVTVTLTIGVNGNGTTEPVPGVHIYTLGMVVNLEAIPDLGWSFDHWAGDVDNSSSAVTNITMDDNKVVTAYFTEDCYTLTVSTVGNGTVDVDPEKECYLYGEEPQLTAVADSHWTFKEWSGDLTGNKNPETINMTGDKEVTATFIGESCVLYITISGNGSGSVIKNPNQKTYAYGTSVNLTVVPATYSKFINWSGDLNSSENPETIIMDGDKYVTANFIGDITPPDTVIILNGTMGENGWYISDVEATLIATDDWSGVAITFYRWDTPHQKWYKGPFIISGDKKHIVEYYSIDHANNIEPINKAEVKIDTKPPVTTHKFDGMMGDSGWFISNVTVTFSARDSTSGVNYTMYKIDEGNWTNYTKPFNITENGTYTIYYNSTDFAGHIEETNKATLKIEKDVWPPNTTHNFSGIIGKNDWYVSDVTVTLIAEDSAAGVAFTYYKLDDDIDWTDYAGHPFPVREDGNHTLCYYSVDKVGNVEKPPKCIDFKIDKTAPTIVLTAKGSGSTWMLTATVSDETSGIDRVEFYVADEHVGTATASPYECEVTNPKKGDKGQAIAFDKAGNEAISPPVDAVPQSQDMIGWTFLIGWISNVEETDNIITAQAIRLRYIEIAPTGISKGFAKMTAVEFSSHNLLGRRIRSFGQMSLVFGIFKGGITIEGE